MKQPSRRRTWIAGFLCGAIALAAVAVLMRTFVVQGLVAKVETSSGSMAPWLVGPHYEAVCDRCQMRFELDAANAPQRALLDCPYCGDRRARRISNEVVAGEAVLIDRSAFARSGPMRWEPVVFRCAEQPGKLCVKRVVGLPGESIEIRDGDICVDGAIVRKSLAEQQATAILVHDSRYPAQDGALDTSGWHTNSTSGWELNRDGFRFEPIGNAQGGASGALLFSSYRRGKAMPISDNYGYNQNVSRRLNRIDDLMFEFDLELRRDSELRLETDAHGYRFELLLRVDEVVAVLKQHGEVVARRVSPARLDPQCHVVVSFIDQRLLVAIAGRTLFEMDVSDLSSRDDADLRQRIALVAEGPVAIGNMRVLRDIHYTLAADGQPGLAGKHRLGPDEYFVLGDNSPISSDSRSWSAPGLASSSIVGRPLQIEP